MRQIKQTFHIILHLNFFRFDSLRWHSEHFCCNCCNYGIVTLMHLWVDVGRQRLKALIVNEYSCDNRFALQINLYAHLAGLFLGKRLRRNNENTKYSTSMTTADKLGFYMKKKTNLNTQHRTVQLKCGLTRVIKLHLILIITSIYQLFPCN